MDLSCSRRVDPVRQSPRSRMYGYFTHGTVPPPRPYSSGFLALPDYLRRLPSPTHFRRRLLGHTSFVVLVVLHSRPSTDRASLATSLSLIGPLTPASSRDPVSPPEVTCCSSVPCHPQSPWYGGCMRTPLPPWCRLDRSHLWPTGSSLGRPPLITARDFSSCLSDSTSRWTPCPPKSANGGFRFALAVSSFRFRARLGFSIPSTSPASEATNPAFGYDTPHPSVGGTLTLLNYALLSTHHGSIGDFSPIAFSGCPRGPRVSRETRCPKHTRRLTGFWRLALEPERLGNQQA